MKAIWKFNEKATKCHNKTMMVSDKLQNNFWFFFTYQILPRKSWCTWRKFKDTDIKWVRQITNKSFLKTSVVGKEYLRCLSSVCHHHRNNILVYPLSSGNSSCRRISRKTYDNCLLSFGCCKTSNISFVPSSWFFLPTTETKAPGK